MLSESQLPGAIRHEPSPKCIACGSVGVELYDGLADYLEGTPQTWRMVRCAREACGMLWLDPRPLAADLIKAYATYHTHGRRSRGAAELALSAVNATCKLASRLLDLGSGLGRQRRQLRTMFIGGAPPGKLLEVGSGSGRFLDRMRRAGWQVQGTDFDPAVARRVRDKYGLQIDVGDLAGLRYPAGTYDVVAMSQVIEHVHDPLALLREAAACCAREAAWCFPRPMLRVSPTGATEDAGAGSSRPVTCISSPRAPSPSARMQAA